MFDLEKMAKQHGVQERTIHGWANGEMITVKMRRPGLYNMAAMGFVPNPLLGAIQAMFSGDSAQLDRVDAKKQGECVIAMAKYALVEPTYAQLTEAGLELTDRQLMDIYLFALGGAAMLAGFRAEDRGQPVSDGDAMADAPERNSAD